MTESTLPTRPKRVPFEVEMYAECAGCGRHRSLTKEDYCVDCVERGYAYDLEAYATALEQLVRPPLDNWGSGYDAASDEVQGILLRALETGVEPDRPPLGLLDALNRIKRIRARLVEFPIHPRGEDEPELQVFASPEDAFADWDQHQERLTAEGAARRMRLDRPSWDATGIALAQVFAARSADDKFKVGAVILSRGSKTVVGAGLNGRYPGAPTEKRASLATGCSEFIHAEQQAIVRARWEHGEKHVLFSTMEPCHECALLILAARHIDRVVYVTPYAGDGTRRRGSEILQEAGVEVVAWE